jgi:hypothetical protein
LTAKTVSPQRDNPESRARQYALVEEAAQLGWPASKIEVIDADLGISGRWAERRSGFREVVSRVCLGEVAPSLAWRLLAWRATTPISHAYLSYDSTWSTP